MDDHHKSEVETTDSDNDGIADSVDSLKELATQVNLIADNTVQVASAAEEQSQVNHEISRSVVGIRCVEITRALCASRLRSIRPGMP